MLTNLSLEMFYVIDKSLLCLWDSLVPEKNSRSCDMDSHNVAHCPFLSSLSKFRLTDSHLQNNMRSVCVVWYINIPYIIYMLYIYITFAGYSLQKPQACSKYHDTPKGHNRCIKKKEEKKKRRKEKREPYLVIINRESMFKMSIQNLKLTL